MRTIWYLICFTLLLMGLTACAFTTQFADIPSGFDQVGNPRVIRTYAREKTNFLFGTDYVIPVGQVCAVNIEGIAVDCEILNPPIVASETFFENLTTGAAIGAFFPLIRPGGSGSSTSSSSATAGAEAAVTINQPAVNRPHRPVHKDRY